MTTVLFVHGTGTREESFQAGFRQIHRALRQRRPNVEVAPCFWGGTFGVELHAQGASIPGYSARGGLDDEVEGGVDPYDVALWGLLYEEPLYELGVIGAGTPEGQLPGAEASALDGRLRALTPGESLRAQLAAAGLEGQWEEARATVLASEPYRQALRVPPEGEGDLPLVVARALVAQAMWLAEREEHDAPALLDANLRDDTVAAVWSALLAPDEGARGLGEWVREKTSDLVLSAATTFLGDRRSILTDVSLPGLGDILFYFTHGKEIREWVRARIRELEPPVVVLAHSLGGIISVDLLAGEPMPEVKLLITAGSQSPFLYEVDALHALRFGEALPAAFPRWINLYDPNDFLSYIAEGIFPGRVRDVEIVSRQPFPRAHSTYWSTPATWDAIVPALP